MKNINSLVSFYDDNKENIVKNWNETQTRIELINPMFECLGWDVNNKQGLADSFKEVIHEDAIKISGGSRAPDYSFNYGRRLFFLEAKKPSVNIKYDISPSYQLRRYAWSAKLPISILTDFEELAVYDGRVKPLINDNPGTARLKYYKYSEYIENWDNIYNLFSKEAIKKGSIDKLVSDNKKIKGTIDVDSDFLKEMERWQIILSQNIAIRNKTLTEKEINYAVQKTIDRLLFLRICEDRAVEEYGQLKRLIENKTGIYKRLIMHFENADFSYNAGLFCFRKIKNGNIPDNLTPNIKIDDKALIDIINNLYYPQCPYQFNEFSADLLGSVYERFLGKEIKLSKTHRATIDYKPEIRKAGGVYYTPDYIVKYIVKNTIGELLTTKTPKQVEKIKILDPACGSGSFLIEAYQYLLDWHLEYYTNDDIRKYKTGKNPCIYETTKGYHLTLFEKRRILLNNIHGVDIDFKAVEVAKLSLLLKVLEDMEQTLLIKEKILPSLHNNIKCGNSLIDSSYYENQDCNLFGNEGHNDLNTFDWEKEFMPIMDNGGFDCVIGNPPYLKERGNKDIFNPILRSNYKKYHQGKMDFWYYFIHRAIDLIKENGIMGFITNSYWVNSYGASKLIQRIKENLSFIKVVNLNDIKVFQNVSGKHMIHIYKKSNKNDDCLYIELDKNNFNNVINDKLAIKIKNKDLKLYKDRIVFSNKANIFKNTEILNLYYEVSQGVVEATNNITKKQYENSKNKNRFNIGEGVFVLSENELKNISLINKEKQIVKKYVNTSHVSRYYVDFQNQYLLYCDKQVKENIKEYPNIKKHLDNVKEFITSSNKPYGLHRPRENKYFECPKIICKGMFSYPGFYIDYDKYYFGFSFSAIIQKDNNYSLEFLLGLLNSKCGNYWFQKNGKKRGVGVDIGVNVFRQFPVPNIDLNNPKEKQVHDNLVNLVNQMLKAQEKYHSAKIESDKGTYKKIIDILDNNIDKLVYELYGLSEKEIKVIENNLKKD
jgi:adenine-specific DNA-methyltransferase